MVIVSIDRMNNRPDGTVIVLPLSTTIRPISAYHTVLPPEGGLGKPSQVQTDHIRAISVERIGPKIGRLSHATMAQVDYLLLVILGLD